jgi:protein-tyrosine phosphatase
VGKGFGADKMIPLVDMHVHLLAGLDDGPRTWDDAVAMCRLAFDEGTRMAAATAHQNDRWCDVTPATIGEAVQRLAQLLQEARIPLTVYPNAEVMAHPDLEAHWTQGRLLSVGDRRKYVLLEMPHQLCVDVGFLIKQARRAGLRFILAHPERHPELLHEGGRIENLIAAGCLVQVSSSSVTDPATRADGRALKSWFRRGCVHLLGSDGHSPRRRAPHMADAYRQICRWAGTAVADRICSTNGVAILQGLPLRIPAPARKRTGWLAQFWS